MNRLSTWWQGRGRRWWSDYHWPVLLFFGLAALILGFIGFTKNGLQTGESRSVLDNLYLTLGLISLNSGAVPPPVSWELQLARFLVPAIAAYTAILALAAIFTQQSQQVRLWFMRDHVIICGLGRKGVRLARQFTERGMGVVVLEADEGNDWVEAARAWGAVVLHGDARDPELLHKARLNRAAHLVSVSGDDGVNAEVAVLAENLSRTRQDGAMTCSIHIVDPQLWYLLRERELDVATDSHFRLELFNIFDRGASLLLQNYSPWAHQQGELSCDLHLVLIGLGKLGQSLVTQAASRWWERFGKTDQRLRFSIIDLYAAQKVETLCVRHPNLTDVCDLDPLQMDVRSADFQRADFLFYEDGSCIADAIYICMDNDSLGLHTGLTLHRKVRDQDIPVIIRMVEDAGLALLFQENDHQDNRTYKNLSVFPLLDQTCTPELILLGTHELVARELHESYLRGLVDEKQDQPGDLVLETWQDLSEEVKERNRKQADRIGLILAEHGYRIVPLTDWQAADFVFSEGDGGDEVGAMARMEHELWCQEMQADGWREGKVRSQENRTNPDLVPWERLPAPEVKKNKKFIRDLPSVLSRAGFQIERQYNIRQ